MDRRTLGKIARLLQEAAQAEQASLVEEVVRYRRARVTEHHLRPRTVYEYSAALDDFTSAVGDIGAHELTAEHVSAWLDSVPRGSRTRVFSALSACIRWLDRHGCPGIAQVLPSRRPKARQYTRYLDDVDLAESWRAIELAERSGWVRGWMADALRVALLVPLRRGELASLRWSEIDFVGRRLLLIEAKTGDRIVPLGPIALSILARQQRGADYVWTGRAGGHVHGTSLHHAWAKVRKRAGLAPIRFHALRHSWASKATRDGEALDHTRRVMGHSTEWMTLKYAHMHADEVRGVVERIERAIVSSPVQCELPLGGA